MRPDETHRYNLTDDTNLAMWHSCEACEDMSVSSMFHWHLPTDNQTADHASSSKGGRKKTARKSHMQKF